MAQGSSSGEHLWHASKHTMNVTVTEEVPTSNMTVLHTVFHSGSTVTSPVVSTTSTVDFALMGSNSISDTQVFRESTTSPLFSTTLISPSLPIETSTECKWRLIHHNIRGLTIDELVPFATLDPTPTTTALIVSTFLTASTDSLGGTTLLIPMICRYINVDGF
jgi:hypothetical protein